MTTIEQKFSGRLQDAIRESRGIGYDPTRFSLMLSQQGALRLAKHLVTSGEIQTGLKELAKLGRKDLTMESIMLELEFASLFTDKELEAARWRLTRA